MITPYNCVVSDTDKMLSKDKFQRMLSLQQRLGDWELVRPGRELLKEGMLQKISRKGVGFVLFKFLSLFILGWPPLLHPS